MEKDLWIFEKKARRAGFSKIAGIDEAGRGPLAGPVVSAAVILPSNFSDTGVDDSKKLTPGSRSSLYERILAQAVTVGIGIVGPAVVDQINILQAALLSMSNAVDRLTPQPDFLLIDGTFGIASDLPQEMIPKGDASSASIAAASIIAKVTRDRLMQAYHQKYPQYGFSQHKGYPTKAHKEAIGRYGCCPIHRKTFKGVKEHI